MTRALDDLVYIGTYTNGTSEGIMALRLDTETGKMEPVGTMAKLPNPSYLAISKDRKFLYAVLETGTYKDVPGGGVAAFSIDGSTGELSPLNDLPTTGKSPCHLSMDEDNRFLFTANYTDGTVSAFSIKPDGSLGSLIVKLVHEGSGPNPQRQKTPHAHFVMLTPDEKHLCAVDLGIDKIMVYDFDKNTGTLTHNPDLTVSVKPGSGPRHMVFHPSGRFAYLVTEMGAEVLVMDYDPASSRFTQKQYISTLPEGYEGFKSGAAIRISPDGKFLYASNRGHDSIAIFKIDQATGELTLVSHSSTYGQMPRDFALDPTGKFLIAANQNSDNVVSFSVNPETGELSKIDELNISIPVCVKFARG